VTNPHAGEHDFAAMPLGAFTAAVAAKTPAPGGGAVAGAVAAQAAALASMVVAYSRGKKSFAAHEDAADAMLDALRIAREASLAAAKADADAYAVLNALWRRPEDDPERRSGWDAAVHDAIRAPSLVVELAGEVAALCRLIA
jgi:formiminotetrahydrofolate cyclodeaminase